MLMIVLADTNDKNLKKKCFFISNTNANEFICHDFYLIE